MIPQHLTLTQYTKRRVHLGLCGSIAAYKAIDVCRALQGTDIKTSAVLSEAGARFVTRLSLEALGVDPVQTGLFSREDSVFAHLEPGQNASLMLILPATANTMAKLAAGISDNMLTCQALAFPGPLLIVPAMNPNLWSAPATQENLARLRNRENVRVMQPEIGEMACGDLGRGKLPPLLDIYVQTLKSLSQQDLSGLKILISLGPTREFWDPVRFWSNPSSGRMGAALAVTAWLRGAEVKCVCGPSDIWLPPFLERQDVVSARQMHEACLDSWPEFDIGCLCAAVSDFRPKATLPGKFKKARFDSGFSIEFEGNPDILKDLGRNKQKGQRLIGFAAETEADLPALSKEKLDKKNLDLICANRITDPGTGFTHATNSVFLLNKQGQSSRLPVMSKADIGWTIWDWILKSWTSTPG